MAKISLEKRQKAREGIIDWMLNQEWEGKELIRQVYNNAVDDVLSAIGIYANENPQHKLAYTSLKEELEWMELPKYSEEGIEK